jgi:DNA-binding NarL/FixJ family response regulator
LRPGIRWGQSNATFRQVFTSRFIPGGSHEQLEHEPAWQRFREAVLPLLRPYAAPTDSVFAALSPRERQVLALMYDGLSNMDIAERLKIREKTVRNHVSNVFDKLGVWSRAQAIVFAREHGFGR